MKTKHFYIYYFEIFILLNKNNNRILNNRFHVVLTHKIFLFNINYDTTVLRTSRQFYVAKTCGAYHLY
jgi:hypothetical protein